MERNESAAAETLHAEEASENVRVELGEVHGGKVPKSPQRGRDSPMLSERGERQERDSPMLNERGEVKDLPPRLGLVGESTPAQGSRADAATSAETRPGAG